MINHHTNTVFFEDVEIPAENLIGEEGMGFRYIIDGWNAERILIAAEAIGDGRWFVDRAASYASSREVFGRPIGANQGVQFPIAQAYANLEAADLVRYQAASKFDRNERCGAEANLAKLLASQASWRRIMATLWPRVVLPAEAPMPRSQIRQPYPRAGVARALLGVGLVFALVGCAVPPPGPGAPAAGERAAASEPSTRGAPAALP